jgi:O-antigen ligase
VNPFFDNSRIILTILIGFAIPISTALTNILCPLAFLLLLLEGGYQQKWTFFLARLKNNPIVIAALLLFAMVGIGFFYTSASMSEAGFMLDKYRELLYIPLFILLFREEKTRRWGLYAFMTAMGITLLVSYLMTVTGLPLGKGIPENAFVFKNYITQSTLMALAAYFLAVLCWQNERWGWLCGIVIVLAIYNIIFLSEGRTGYLILFCLILLFSYQSHRIRGLVVGSIFLMILSFLAYNHSNALHKRISHLPEQVQEYQQGNTSTSIGMRLEFYKNSITLIAQQPLFGYGTGSFSYEYNQLSQQQDSVYCENPHNEYLMIGMQWGLVGITFFVYLLFLLWYTATRLENPQAWMAQGFVITMAVGSLVNSLLLDTTEGHLFAYLTAVFYAGLNTSSSTATQGNSNTVKHFNMINWLNLMWNIKYWLLFFLIISIGFIGTYLWLIPHFHAKAPIVVDQKMTMAIKVAIALQEKLKETANNCSSPEKTTTAIGIDLQGATFAVNSQFQPLVTTEKGLTGNQLTLSTTDTITVSNQIQLDEQHVAQAAHFIIIVIFQPPGKESEKVYFQRVGKTWKPFDFKKLNTAQYEFSLPEHFELPIYQGPIIAGEFTIFVAYLLEDNRLVMSLTPVQFQVDQR